jgi:hypothetical protein
MRPLTIQGSYVGTVEELRELVELVKETHMSAIPVKKLPISDQFRIWRLERWQRHRAYCAYARKLITQRFSIFNTQIKIKKLRKDLSGLCARKTHFKKMSQNNGELKMKQMKNYFYHRSNQKIAALVFALTAALDLQAAGVSSDAGDYQALPGEPT